MSKDSLNSVSSRKVTWLNNLLSYVFTGVIIMRRKWSRFIKFLMKRSIKIITCFLIVCFYRKFIFPIWRSDIIFINSIFYSICKNLYFAIAFSNVTKRFNRAYWRICLNIFICKNGFSDGLIVRYSNKTSISRSFET